MSASVWGDLRNVLELTPNVQEFLGNMYRFANPTRFMAFAERWVWIAWVVTAVLLASALYLIVYDTPPAELHGAMVRMLFIHVPSAWMALFCYSVMAVSSLVSLIWRHPLADITAMATAPIGAVFTALALFTGSLWGHEAWGTWWVWSDNRMTSTFVLLLQFIGYMLLVHAFDDPGRGRRFGAYLVIAGIVNVLIVKWGVEWFNSLHQSASVDKDGSSISGEYGWQLLLMTLACQVSFVGLVVARMRVELDRLRIQQTAARLRRQQLTATFQSQD